MSPRQIHAASPPLGALDSGENPFLQALDALQPNNQRQKSEAFAAAYPGIVRAIARKVPMKLILNALATNGLKLHPVRFRELLEEERNRRDTEGNPVRCACCDAIIESKVPPTMAAAIKRTGSPEASG